MLAVQVDYMNAVENARHNRENEQYNTLGLQESKRHSLIVERLQKQSQQETKRNNRALERIRRGELGAKEEANRIAAQNAESQAKQAIISEKLAEEQMRHNQAMEFIDAEKNEISRNQAQSSRMQAEASQRSSRASEISAEAAKRNAATNRDNLSLGWYQSSLRRRELDESARKTDVGAGTDIFGTIMRFAGTLF